MKYGYARVSTKGQANDGNSLKYQKELLYRSNADVVYEEAYTGKNLERPVLDELLLKLKPGDTVIVTKLDRFARSISKASELITELIDKGITVHVLNIGILDNSSTSTLFRNMLLAFAQFERDMIVERTQEGKAIAKKNPAYKEGRPNKYSKIQLDHAMTLLENNSYQQVTKLTGISKSTLIRYKRKFLSEKCFTK